MLVLWCAKIVHTTYKKKAQILKLLNFLSPNLAFFISLKKDYSSISNIPFSNSNALTVCIAFPAIPRMEPYI